LSGLRKLAELGSKRPMVLRVLNLEDSALDTELMQANLAKGGIDCEMVRVQTRVDFVAALEDGGFDLILADHTVSSIDGLLALELARGVRPEVPFILVSNTVDEDLAIELMRKGATDYVPKHRLERLVPAVHRATREAVERRERERAEEALRRSEERYRTLVEQIPAATYTQQIAEPGSSRTNPTLYASPQIESQSGYPPQSFVEDPELWIKILHPEDRERVLAEDRRTDETGEPFRMEYRQITRDGRTVWIRDEAVLVRDEDGRSRFWQGVMYDITERKTAEEKLAYHAHLLENMQDAVLATDERFVITAWNKGAEEMFGWRADEVLGCDARKVSPSEFTEERRAEVLRELADTGQFRTELTTYRKDGTPIPTEEVTAALRTERGEVTGYLSIIRDITERKRVEEELKESEARFRAIFEQATVGMVQVGLDGEWIRFNDRFCEILGYTREEMPAVHFRDILVPEDLGKEVERGARMLSGEFRDYSEEKRIRRKDGSQAWIYLTVSSIYSSNGPEHFVAVVEDITEHRQAEIALTRNEILYRTVIEQAAENILIVDLESKRILEANAALQRSLGYEPEELKDVTLYDIVAHDNESIDENTKRIMAEDHYFIGERSYRRKDGTLVDMEVSVSTVPYGGRDAMAIVAHDITERKKAEENLRHSLSVLLALREAGQVLGSTLSSEEIVLRLLEIMRGVSRLTAVVLSVQGEDGELRIWRSAGLESLRRRARFEQEAEAARRTTLEGDEHCTFRLSGSRPEDSTLIGLCLPLRIKDRIVGVLEAYGEESLAGTDTLEILGSLSNQAASALEHAWLYEELGERERALQDLVGKLLGAQEEERRRVAYEVHDGLAQVAVAAHQNLQAFARRHAPDTERGQRELEQILEQVRATVSDARRIIANLRPTALDDLGLAAALSLEVEHLREDGYQVHYEENLRDQRLPDSLEIALFRIAQEALTNMRKHAQTRRVRIRLGRSDNEAYLQIQDYGRGFDPVRVSAGSGPGERVGLAGMRERIGMLGGELEIHSRPDAGTSISVTVPVA
jgi:PAS domain S-box-containing protein